MCMYVWLIYMRNKKCLQVKVFFNPSRVPSTVPLMAKFTFQPYVFIMITAFAAGWTLNTCVFKGICTKKTD